MEREQIRISVRNLVEFILRSGDIDNRRASLDTMEAMQAGSRLHRKIQKKMGSTYHAEVPLNIIIEEENYELGIWGRADGIIIEERYIWHRQSAMRTYMESRMIYRKSMFR